MASHLRWSSAGTPTVRGGSGVVGGDADGTDLGSVAGNGGGATPQMMWHPCRLHRGDILANTVQAAGMFPLALRQSAQHQVPIQPRQAVLLE